jgi:hypothetical protein
LGTEADKFLHGRLTRKPQKKEINIGSKSSTAPSKDRGGVQSNVMVKVYKKRERRDNLHHPLKESWN